MYLFSPIFIHIPIKNALQKIEHIVRACQKLQIKIGQINFTKFGNFKEKLMKTMFLFER